MQEANADDATAWKVFRANNITLSSNMLNFEDVKLVSSEVKVRDNQKLRKGDILICAGSGSKEHIGKVAYINEDMDYTFGGFMAVIRCPDVLDSRFLFHVLTSDIFGRHLEKAVNSSTINNLNASVMQGLRFPLPPLPVQREIVAILDRFDALVNDLSGGIPAEIAARKKQYEYYRDRLLAFDEVK